ncbi:MAG TPA: hypothetical protein VFP77_01175, partial [Gemmatimonadaceae bacterium]|nr:hypothetical protein [Gemmatimonadaceae bacterium]
MIRFTALAAAVMAGAILPAIANAQDTAVTRLEPVIVEVSRGAGKSLLDLPYAISVQTPDSARPGQRHLSLDETLWLIPGL